MTPIFIGNSTLYADKYLVTNEQYCSFLNALPIANVNGGLYNFYNHYLFDSRIKLTGQSYFSSLTDLDSAVEICSTLTDQQYYITPGFEHHPVVCINWLGAEVFARSLGFRLPTSQEWVSIASRKAQHPGRFSWGNTPPDPALANYGELVGRTTPAGHYPPDSNGLYDLMGNVREWCFDGPNGNEEARYVKGGGWNKPAEQMAILYDEETWVLHSGASIGFRVYSDHL